LRIIAALLGAHHHSLSLSPRAAAASISATTSRCDEFTEHDCTLRDFGVETLPCLQRGELCQDVFGDDRVEEGGALARDRVGDFEERKSMPRFAILVCMC
jgi:hypothetical protein